MLITRTDLDYISTQGFYVPAIKTCFNAPGFSSVYSHNELDWAKNYDKNKLQQATNRGINFDKAIQEYYEMHSCQLGCKAMLQSAQNLIENIEPIGQEIFAFGKIINQPLLGFIDAIADIDSEALQNIARVKYKQSAKLTNGLTIIDWKTKASNNFNPIMIGRYIIQISVYARLAKIFYDIDVKQGMIAIAFATGEPCQILCIDKPMMKDAMSVFKGKLHSYKAKTNIAWRGAYSL